MPLTLLRLLWQRHGHPRRVLGCGKGAVAAGAGRCAGRHARAVAEKLRDADPDVIIPVDLIQVGQQGQQLLWGGSVRLQDPSKGQGGAERGLTWSSMLLIKVVIGIAFSGWKIYEWGELSTMMVRPMSRPRHSRSFTYEPARLGGGWEGAGRQAGRQAGRAGRQAGRQAGREGRQAGRAGRQDQRLSHLHRESRPL